jgi:hypothetical protein
VMPQDSSSTADKSEQVPAEEGLEVARTIPREYQRGSPWVLLGCL